MAIRRTEPNSPLLGRSFLLLLLASLGGFSNIHLLFAVAPQYVTTAGAGTVGAGLVTGALMATTVVTQPIVPRLISHLGYARTLAAGLVLLGAPTLALPLSRALPLVLAVSLIRGVGFGISTVTGSALTAELIPAVKRGTGMGLYGLAVGLPAMLALPLGVWLVDQVGYTPVFVAAAVFPLAALAAAGGIRAPAPASRAGKPPRRNRVFAGLRSGALARPFIMLGTVTAAAGIVKTFLPLAVPAHTPVLASTALFAQLAMVTLTRALSGVLGDRIGSTRLLVPGMLLVGVGMLGISATGRPAVLVIAAAIAGLGLGVVQTTTLVVMMSRVSRTAFGSVSAQWNMAFDAGTGLGATLFGAMVRVVTFTQGFAVVAGLVFAVSFVAVRDAFIAGRNGTR